MQAYVKSPVHKTSSYITFTSTTNRASVHATVCSVLSDNIFKNYIIMQTSRADIEQRISPHIKTNKSSAVAKMGDHGHNRHGPKRGGAAVPLSRVLGPRLVQCGLSRGLLPYQVASSSIQPFGTVDMGQKLGEVGVPFFLRVAGSTSNTMPCRPRPTSVPSGILIHGQAAAWIKMPLGTEATVDLQFSHGSLVNTVRRRNWRQFSYADFCDDLSQSALLRNPLTDAASLFTCYHETLLALVDKHAPFADTRINAHLNGPWYDGRC